MKFCPKCQLKYDEDIIRFCTKDGTPLVDENPSFTAMPSQSSIDDIGEETLITRNRPTIPPTPVSSQSEEPAQRVVIAFNEEKKQAVRPLENSQNQYQQPRKSNTALIVLLTMFGTIAVLAGGVGGVFRDKFHVHETQTRVDGGVYYGEDGLRKVSRKASKQIHT